MGNVVSNTADILAILGGATTLIIGIFGAIRLSRCQTVRCCWGCVDLINKPPGDATPPGVAKPPTPPGGAQTPAAVGDLPRTLPALFPSASPNTLTPSNSEVFINPVNI